LKVSVEVHKQILSGSEFQTDGAAAEKVHQAMSVLVRGTDNSGAQAECRCLAGCEVQSISHAAGDAPCVSL